MHVLTQGGGWSAEGGAHHTETRRRCRASMPGFHRRSPHSQAASQTHRSLTHRSAVHKKVLAGSRHCPCTHTLQHRSAFISHQAYFSGVQLGRTRFYLKRAVKARTARECHRKLQSGISSRWPWRIGRRLHLLPPRGRARRSHRTALQSCTCHPGHCNHPDQGTTHRWSGVPVHTESWVGTRW